MYKHAFWKQAMMSALYQMLLHRKQLEIMFTSTDNSCAWISRHYGILTPRIYAIYGGRWCCHKKQGDLNHTCSDLRHPTSFTNHFIEIQNFICNDRERIKSLQQGDNSKYLHNHFANNNREPWAVTHCEGLERARNNGNEERMKQREIYMRSSDILAVNVLSKLK